MEKRHVIMNQVTIKDFGFWEKIQVLFGSSIKFELKIIIDREVKVITTESKSAIQGFNMGLFNEVST